jgi:hypothetical protein
LARIASSATPNLDRYLPQKRCAFQIYWAAVKRCRDWANSVVAANARCCQAFWLAWLDAGHRFQPVRNAPR